MPWIWTPLRKYETVQKPINHFGWRGGASFLCALLGQFVSLVHTQSTRCGADVQTQHSIIGTIYSRVTLVHSVHGKYFNTHTMHVRDLWQRRCGQFSHFCAHIYRLHARISRNNQHSHWWRRTLMLKCAAKLSHLSCWAMQFAAPFQSPFNAFIDRSDDRLNRRTNVTRVVSVCITRFRIYPDCFYTAF